MPSAGGLLDEHVYSATSSSTPTDTPYRTPMSLSRQSSRYPSSPAPSSSPPPPPMPMPPDSDGVDDPESAHDETISLLDPRRFTPTLHASLVSEILSVRRDLDSKNAVIEQLENSVETARVESDRVERELASTAKETRALRRQLQLLEGGTASALVELTHERGAAVDSVADLKRRLDAAQKGMRAEEEHSHRTQRLWDRDKQQWEEQRRKMERKVHVVEGRLKAILEEVAAQQAATHARPDRLREQADVASEADDDGLNDLIPAEEVGIVRSPSRPRVRPMSASSVNSQPTSILRRSKSGGRSLADELGRGEENDEPSEEDDASVDQFAVPRVMGDEGMGEGGESPRASRDPNPSAFKRMASYVDAGSQCSRPPTPPPSSVSPSATPATAPRYPAFFLAPGDRDGVRTDGATNERAGGDPTTITCLPSSVSTFVSASCQTMEAPPSSPRTPHTTGEWWSPVARVAGSTMSMISCATQTEPSAVIALPERPVTPPALTIPSIAIHPPTSAPNSPGRPLLPPHTKHAACQVSIDPGRTVRSITVQTEEIRIDQRRGQLPAHLLPSAISSVPPSPEAVAGRRLRAVPSPSPPPPTATRSIAARPRPDPPSSPPAAAFRPDAPTPPDDARWARGPRWTGSDSARADLPSSDDGDDFHEVDFSETDVPRTALSAPRPRPPSRRISTPHPNPQGPPAAEATARAEHGAGSISPPPPPPPPPPLQGGPRIPSRSSSTEPSLDPRRTAGKSLRRVGSRMGTVDPPALIRRPSLTFDDDHRARLRRTGSPTVQPRTEPDLPFPVPTRSSSRRIPWSASDGGRSPSRPSGSSAHARRGGGILMAEKLRKVRSATAIARPGGPGWRRSRSPPAPLPLSSSPPPPLPLAALAALASPRRPPPPVPNDDRRTVPSGADRGPPIHRPTPSHAPSPPRATSSDSARGQQEIVDAIAQTMVGEWMWKYVRRRKSFGIPDHAHGAGDDLAVNGASSGVRHQRWVWLAPYERAVMWSSKQPTTGTALLGKTGRKLTIQSVLDVKDDAPAPKPLSGHAVFDRSILILTPARALKFTARTRERHYVWLTALAFLSRPSMGAHELGALPPPVVPPLDGAPAARAAGTVLRRHPIRDSIRIAPGKRRPRSTKDDAGAAPDGVMGPSTGGLGTGPSSASLPRGLFVTTADAPAIPRFPSHGRHRSNTGGRPPLGAKRSFTHPPLPTSIPSFAAWRGSTATATATAGDGSSTTAMSGLGHAPSRARHRTSDASSATGRTTVNFFDAMPTVRMEAFVHGAFPFAPPDGGKRAASGGSRPPPPPPPPPPLDSPHGRKGAGGERWARAGQAGHHHFARPSDDGDDVVRVDDPFGGF
ncbi:MAG: hypothetical protein M1826_004050 [Phylliscum demangeonii]|nr:MAG: hypothetical protein M1826_004050 [Phylliscum demangeonii]